MIKEDIKKFVCIHGHFYQPYRKNPWTGQLQLQKQTYPYGDWNEKINAQCYRANAFARILGQKGRIRDIVNNYAGMSFNFGPTLLEWIRENDPKTYEAILSGDRQSLDVFSGHGSAIAQAYNHIIMPLSHQKDKEIQVAWAIHDFEEKFKRRPEGMWLAETAVDHASLEVLADYGIKFTVLSPYQAQKIRKIKDKGPFTDVSGGSVHTRTAYICRLPSGREISLFFYDRDLSTEVSFGDILKNGHDFTERIKNSFSKNQAQAEIIVIASDGEAYGHHKKFAEMALAYCIEDISKSSRARLTVFGQYLQMHPPEYEAVIFENTAWSCAHNLSRWSDGCACGMGQDFQQDCSDTNWRRPLREGIDLLRKGIDTLFYAQAPKYLKDKDAADAVLFAFIRVINDRRSAHIGSFLEKYIKRDDAKEPEDMKSGLLKLLEMQRQAMLMQSSDGWFFDDITRIEAAQILRHALMALSLAACFEEKGLYGNFLNTLQEAKSNVVKGEDGRTFFHAQALGYRYNASAIAAHFAAYMLMLLQSSGSLRIAKQVDFYCHEITVEKSEHDTSGGYELLLARISMLSTLTLERSRFCFCCMHENGELQDNMEQGAFITIMVSKEQACPEEQNGTDVFFETAKKIYKEDDIGALVQYLKEQKIFEVFHLNSLDERLQAGLLDKIIKRKLRKALQGARQSQASINGMVRSCEGLDSFTRVRDSLDMADALLAKAALLKILDKEEIDAADIERMWEIAAQRREEDPGQKSELFSPGHFKGFVFALEKKITLFFASAAHRGFADGSLKEMVMCIRVLDKFGILIDGWQIQNILFHAKETLFKEQKYKEEAILLLDHFAIEK